MKKLFSILALSIIFTGFNIAPSYAEGIIEDKDTIENRGPGNLDAPTEATPKKATTQQVEKAEKKAEDQAPKAAAPKAEEAPAEAE